MRTEGQGFLIVYEFEGDERSLIIKDDGRACHAHVRGPAGNIVSEVWLYNRVGAPAEAERVQPGSSMMHGDGGCNVCGGVGFFLGWLPLATAFREPSGGFWSESDTNVAAMATAACGASSPCPEHDRRDAIQGLRNVEEIRCRLEARYESLTPALAPIGEQLGASARAKGRLALLRGIALPEVRILRLAGGHELEIDLWQRCAATEGVMSMSHKA